MWYRYGKIGDTSISTAKPWKWPVHKRKKIKTKKFNLIEDEPENMEQQGVVPQPDSPKAPANVEEFPDLPAGVKIPPAQLPYKDPSFEVDKSKEKALNEKPKPKELEKLYGPDHDIQDDHVEHTPKHNLIPEVQKEKIPTPDIEPDIVPEDESEDGSLEEDNEFEKPIDQTNQPVPNPPVHDFCHCEVITMPGGRRIWRANEGACNDCLNARDTFNQWQMSLFGS